MYIIIFFCLFFIIFFACFCISIEQRIMKKLDFVFSHFEGWLENLRSDIYDLQEENTEQHSILEDKIISSGKKSEETAQAYDDLTQDVVKLMFGQGAAVSDSVDKE